MKQLTKNENLLEFIYEDEEYLIPTRLVAFYLSKRLLSFEKYNSVDEANELLWNHFTKYINNIELCKFDAHKYIKYILSNYSEFYIF